MRRRQDLIDARIAELDESTDIKELYLDLLIHQEELRAQNEELLQSQQRAATAEKRYQSILGVAPIGFCIVNSTGVIVDHNYRLAELIDSPFHLNGRPLISYIADEGASVAGLIRQIIRTRSKDTVWSESLIKTGKNLISPVRIGYTLFPFSGEEMVLLSITDMSGEIESRKAHKDAIEMRNRFIANVSHELRTPLQGLLSTLELMSSHPDGMDQFAKECLERGISSGQILRRIVNDVLDLTKVDSGKFDLVEEAFELSDLVRSCVESVQASADKKSLKLDVQLPDDPNYVLADPVRIKQILLNLLSNALKFTDEGQVSIRLAVNNTDSDTLRVSFFVTDTGRGMSEIESAKVFQPFAQTRASDGQTMGGTGLGLTIVRQLARLMGGDVTVLSSKGEGSEFRVVLFLKQSEEQRDRLGLPTGMTDLSELFFGRRFLIVDDSDINIAILGLMLKQAGAVVVSASEGHQALSVLDELNGDVDIVLTDLQMPTMGGIELTRRLRQDERFEKVAVVGATGGVDSETRQRALKSGMQAIITKPFLRDELFDLLCSVLD